MNYVINFSQPLSGTLAIPASKSHTLRAILFASLAKGKSVIENYLLSPDAEAMMVACRQLGAVITVTPTEIKIEGVGGQPHTPDDVINAGNSGLVLRFITTIAALLPTYTIITGDHSIRHLRPMQPVIDGINQLGAFGATSKLDGYAPIIVRGPLKAGRAKILGTDSQPVSALLMSAAFVEGVTEIEVINPGEKSWIGLTLSWLSRLGIRYEHHDYSHYKVYGKTIFSGFHYRVPGDLSSVAFPIVAALITKSEISLIDVDMNDVQGDKVALKVLEEMGAVFVYDKNKKILHVKASPQLKGTIISVNDFVDAVPILTVAACFAKGKTVITDGAIARHKESDRLAVMATELGKMGAKISVTDDGLIIEPQSLQGAVVQSHNDHRIAMSLVVAALGVKGKTTVEGTECIAKTYPNFLESMQALGVEIKIIKP